MNLSHLINKLKKTDGNEIRRKLIPNPLAILLYKNSISSTLHLKCKNCLQPLIGTLLSIPPSPARLA